MSHATFDPDRTRPHARLEVQEGCRETNCTVQVHHLGVHLIRSVDTGLLTSTTSSLPPRRIGTYGRVYKAQIKQAPSPSLNPSDPPKPLLYAIKKFKPDKEGERTTYTGISQSAIREISLNRELSVVVDEARDGKTEGGRCENFVTLREVILEDKSIYMVFEYAEHDFLVCRILLCFGQNRTGRLTGHVSMQQIIHYHSQTIRQPIPPRTLKSLLHQLIIGVAHLHANFILHRDLKPANILVTSRGVVKIGDLGLARINRDPLLPLWNGDKVVVTIWYRSPELLLGARHYTAAIGESRHLILMHP